MTMRRNQFESKHFFEDDKHITDSQVWHFVSAPHLQPMKVTVNVHEPGTEQGYLFVAPYTMYGENMVGQTGALILDEAGNPVWFKSDTPDKQNRNFRMQVYHGLPVLTTWHGTISGTESANPRLPIGDPLPGAVFQIFNQHYQLIETVEAQNGYTADVHEFTITERNTALFTAVKQVPADLTVYGGPAKGYIDNFAIQEVDLSTGELLYEWDVLAHVDPANSMVPVTAAAESKGIWDCFHVNSVEEGPDHTLLISMRNMSAIYHIDKVTGEIIWQLGGKQSDFTFEQGAEFSWQHHARYRKENRISLFDNACCATPDSPPAGASRGLILQLDEQHMTAKVDRTYFHDPPIHASNQGNMQQLPNGNQLIGWGQGPYVSEFKYAGNTEGNPALHMIYDMHFPGDNFTYRAFKNEWVGLPLEPPDMRVGVYGKQIAIIYMSWNGATEVEAWKVLAGWNPYAMAVVAFKERNGFETTVKLDGVCPYFQVCALDDVGAVIGKSRMVCAPISWVNLGCKSSWS
ncbi:arylsulfotransferase family protein [Sporosarcina sp. FSL W7-1283]